MAWPDPARRGRAGGLPRAKRREEWARQSPGSCYYYYYFAYAVYRQLVADSARPARGGLALRPSHTPEFFSTGRSSSSQVASVSRDRTQVGALKFSVRVVLVLVGV